jgi:undecaprenyl diphosphate synthase
VTAVLDQTANTPNAMPRSTPNPPHHVAVIMDGNGRWAGQRGLPRIEGHRAGIESVREIVRTAGEAGIEYLTLYAFSIENWNRPDSEVRALMELLEIYLQSEQTELNEKNVRLRAIGRLEELPESTRRQLDASIAALDKNTGMTLVLALSYGGRAEIVDAARSIARDVRDGKLKPEQIDDRTISGHLYTREFPDPDLLIRTSGGMRVSNFLLWQISYAEIYVTETLWPDFRKDQFYMALEDYGRRHRRFGRVQDATGT